MFQKVMDLIPGKLKEAETWSLLCKRIIYIACFAWLCYLDHIIGSATGFIQYSLKNYTGVVMGILILTAYKLKDFIKIPYLVWTVVFFIGRHFALEWALVNYDNQMEFASYVWNVGVYGLVIIRMIYYFAVEKKKPQMNWYAFAIWLVMIVGMIVVRPDVDWPKRFLVFFGLFYLTEYGKRGLNNLFVGMVEGIIVGFCIIQGQAFMHRPYDTLRYQGLYSNPNMNALFYLFCYCAVLCKWYQMKLKRRNVLLRVPCILLVGVLFGLTVMTMGRTALIVMALITLLFLLFQVLSRRKWYLKILELVVDTVVILAVMVVCLVPTYNLVRYVPAYVDEPIYFEGDNEDYKIQPGDPVDAERYISFEYMLTEAFERVLWFGDTSIQEVIGQELFDWMNSFTMVAEAADVLDEEIDWSILDEVDVEPGTDENHPLLTADKDISNPMKVRMSIYRYYLTHIKLFGERDGVINVWVTNAYSAPHAHNIFLHIAGTFGWVICLVFMVIVLLVYNTVGWGLGNRRSGSRYYQMFLLGGFTTVLIGFGMLEMSWIYGQIPFTMLFVVQYLICHRLDGNFCKKQQEENMALQDMAVEAEAEK